LQIDRPAGARPSQIVTLHPATVDRCLAGVEHLADVLDEPDLVAALRSLVETVIVHAPANSDQLTIEIRASLPDLVLPGPIEKRAERGVSGPW
jgi:hypothetical protein